MNYSTDRAIEKLEDDLLGRAPFSRHLARAIYEYKERESLVIGLYGKWGTGKTSVANMAIATINELSKDDEEKPIIVRFTPWNYSDKDSLIYRFFVEMKAKLVKMQELKKYIFIIDEINRGEISKILGELFFSIDPGYRGRAGEVATQYANMHANQDERFYIPENVYIIGTMNDIDRSVDSFDFAMRRRFRFVEIKAEDTQDMLESLENEDLKNEAVERMDKLNAEILTVEDLNENYQIGASYFLKLKTVGFDVLWTDYLCPLLREYVRGLYDEKGIMKRFAKAYGYMLQDEGVADETTQD